jgi:hypothetical protein
VGEDEGIVLSQRRRMDGFLRHDRATGMIRNVTIDWREPRAPCKKYGGPATPSSQGIVTLDSCTIEADVRVVLTRLG